MCLMVMHLWGKYGSQSRTAFSPLQSCWFCWILHGLNITALLPGMFQIFLFGTETAAADFCLIPGQLKHGQRRVCTLVCFQLRGLQWGNVRKGHKILLPFFVLFCFLSSFSISRAQGSWQDFSPEWMDGGEDPSYCCNHQFWNGSRQSKCQVCELSVVLHQRLKPEQEEGKTSVSITWYIWLKHLMKTCWNS